MQQIGAGRVVGPVVDRYPQPRGPRRAASAARAARARPRAARCPTPTSSASCGARPGSHAGRRWLGRGRADLPRRSAARGRSHRGGRPALRLRQARRRPSRSMTPGRAAAGPAGRRATAWCAACCTAAGLSEAVTFGFIEQRRRPSAFVAEGDAAHDRRRRESAVGEVRRAAAVAAAGPGRRGRAQPPARPTRCRRCSRSARASPPSAAKPRRVALAWTGAAAAEHWSGAAREVDFFDVKGVVELLCDALGVDVRLDDVRVPYLVRRPERGGHARRRHDGRRHRSGDAGRRRTRRRAAPGRGLRRRTRSRPARPRGAATGDRVRCGRCRAIRSSCAISRSSSPMSLPAEIIRGTIQAAA